MPGSLTNPSYKEFFEPDVLLTIDPTSDQQAIKEAVQMRIPIIALADTINSLSFIDLAIPCNNKSKDSIGTVLWVLANEINKIKKSKTETKKEDFVPNEEERKRDKERMEANMDDDGMPVKFHRKTTKRY